MNVSPKNAGPESIRRGPVVECMPGKFVYPMDPDFRDWRPEDFARRMAGVRRWNGYGSITLAHHTLAVEVVAVELWRAEAERRQDPKMAAADTRYLRRLALLHDVEEVVIGDITSPVKECFSPKAAAELEVTANRLRFAAYRQLFGESPPYPFAGAVKRADAQVCRYEAERLLMEGEWVRSLPELEPGAWGDVSWVYNLPQGEARDRLVQRLIRCASSTPIRGDE